MDGEHVLEALRDERHAALLDTLFSSAPVGLAFLDEQLRFVRVNDALAALHGVSAEEHVGRAVLEVVPAMDPEVLDCMRRVLATGEPVKDLEFVGRTSSEPDVERHWVYGLPEAERREAGEVLGVLVESGGEADAIGEAQPHRLDGSERQTRRGKLCDTGRRGGIEGRERDLVCALGIGREQQRPEQWIQAMHRSVHE